MAFRSVSVIRHEFSHVWRIAFLSSFSPVALGLISTVAQRGSLGQHPADVREG